MSLTTLICVTPVKNEEWILDRFLQCASQWADHIVIADQHSEDTSPEKVRRFDKAILIENPSPAYDEGARQRLLLEAARRIPVAGKRIILALDADEMLSANWRESMEWQQLLEAPVGTRLYFQWVNVAPGVERGWVPEEHILFGMVDDGRSHTGERIHSGRVPTFESAPMLLFNDIKVLHYQYTDWQRMKSKQRWYQCWERLHNPDKRPVLIYRQYHHMDAARRQAKPIEPIWLAGYEQAGIDMRNVDPRDHYYWDEALVDLFEEHGVDAFRKLNVWEVDWGWISKEMGRETNGALRDPRSSFERLVHGWLSRTQAQASNFRVRVVQKLLQLTGW